MTIKNFLNEFKKFAMRGNVIDMAVGIIIGTAFGKIVDSVVKDMIMPPLGLLLGRVDFTNLYFVLKDGIPKGPYTSLDLASQAGAVRINYGMFINTVISFLIIAFAVFMLIKAVNQLQSQLVREETAPTTKSCPFCFNMVDQRATRCPHCTSDL
jgi:large conductance mechanosensitive channel